MPQLPAPPPPGIPRRAWRDGVARLLARPHHGVVLRRSLLAAGITKNELDAELAAGRWVQAGPNTIGVLHSSVPAWLSFGSKHDGHHLPEGVPGASPHSRQSRTWRTEGVMRPPGVEDVGSTPVAMAPLWWAVWESGTGAVLDGASSLAAAGLRGFTLDVIDVSVGPGARIWRHPGIRVTRRRPLGTVACGGIPRVQSALATIRAAQLAVSDRQAALLIALAVQQRLVPAVTLLEQWADVTRSRRRGLIDAVVRDVCQGAHSLGELDFARLCRRRGLPEPIRQEVRRGPRGRVYLDAAFACGLVVEIDGAQHFEGLAPVDDALRANAVTLQNHRVLRIPVLGLRLTPEQFMDQVAEGIRRMTTAA